MRPLHDILQALSLAVRLLPGGLLMLACLCGIELGLRTDFAFDNLPLPRVYYTYDVTRKVHNLRQLRWKHGRIDVLFVGSSVIRADLQPETFDEFVREHDGGDIASFNVGLSKMYPGGAALYLERLWLDRARPRFVVHGVREAELASRQARPYYLKHGRVEQLWMEETHSADIEAQLIQELTLLQQQGVLRRSLARLRAGQPLHQVEKGEIMSNARGYRAESRTLSEARKRHSKRLWKYRRVPKSSRYSYSIPAMERMHAACEAAGAQYVLLHLPEHPDRWNAENGPATWEDYKKRIRAFAAERDIPYIDVTDGDLTAFGDDAYYSDYHHMRTEGAEAFTRLVAEHMLPLLKSR